VIAIRLDAAENVWPRPLARRTASIVAAVQQEFQSIEMLAGATLYVFASTVLSPATPRCFWPAARPRPPAAPDHAPYLEYLYTTTAETRSRGCFGRRPSTGRTGDAAPVCYQYAR